ncbi:pyroglutamyl-peptidase I [Fervidicoccus fontis]|jgi:pyroglutamyl-peptidase|uniref:Pyrrolidone-carboxylate peptidase n=1 Tax=Fervidicoccus fontis TaxID=683846 RepID=A0A2J6N917_9CREN|nr:pyroglutamyl-peptidase I [Fervidicoccus fontis]MBE9391650.1 pyroglutamyl-peptidase I [Fervidicoccus fontis]PMB75952.1 MAG: pyroglutamyl-peptidase I [Fervidicoccus fontis]PMB77839.1 MAG: pyroglutamyl-peptidase I [Fervidicoccus fontis]HEW63514.1 pyroglutamyl-peptidase I [Fervidicoccus fontis]
MEKYKILVTGFEPFGGYKQNPSQIIAEHLPEKIEKEMPNVELQTAILPVAYKKAKDKLLTLLDSYKPDIVLSMGLWAGISYVTMERVAVNIMDARIPDNDGYQPIDEPIYTEGPNAYFSTLPIKSIVKRLKESGIPASVSNTAGTFLCNYVMYIALHSRATKGYPRRSGYMHVPLLPEQTASVKSEFGIPPSMSLENMIRAAIITLKVTVEKFYVGDEKISL